MDLIAEKSFRYRGRALQADERFTAERRHGRVLVAARRAREPTAADLGTIRTPAPRLRTKDPMDDDGNGSKGGARRQEPSAELADARQRYKDVTGKKRVFAGWSVEEINQRIAEHMAADQERPVTDPDAPQDAQEEAKALQAAEAGDTSPPAEPETPEEGAGE